MSKGRWQAWELQILKTHWQSMTDKEIGERLGRDADAIYRKRRVLGLQKGNGRPTNDSRKKAAMEQPTEYSLAQLSKDERVKFYKSQFSSNWRYKHLLRILLAGEVEYYKHKYIEMINSMDSITIVEEDLLHNMIMCEIQIIRIQEQIKTELEAFKDADDDDARPPPQYLYKDLNDSEQRYIKYQRELNLTRQQRMKDNREEDVTIATIVQGLLDKRNRADADRLAGEMGYFSKRCRNDMDKMDFLLGGD